MKEYRQALQQLEQESQRQYDTTLITLSSGAIVLSFTYLTQLKEPYAIPLLLLAWVAWGLSLAAMLLSFLATVHALRKGQDQVDNKETPTGGKWARCIIPTNWLAGALLLAGAIFMMCFAIQNIGGQDDAKANSTATTSTINSWGSIPEGPAAGQAGSSSSSSSSEEVKKTHANQPSQSIAGKPGSG